MNPETRPSASLRRRLTRAVTVGPLSTFLRRCSRHVADRLFGHTDRPGDVRLPYAVYFFSGAEHVPVRAARPPLTRRTRRSRRGCD